MKLMLTAMVLVAMVLFIVGCPNGSEPPVGPSISSATISMTVTDDLVVTLTVVTTDPAIDSFTARMLIGGQNATVTNESWNDNVFTGRVSAGNRTGALLYSVAAKNKEGPSGPPIEGPTKGAGGGWVYYAKNAGEDGATLATNPAIDGWYELSEELPGTYAWKDVQGAIETFNASDDRGGKNDWEWPTKAELDAARQSLYASGRPLQDSTLENYLWSSSEVGYDPTRLAFRSSFNKGNDSISGEKKDKYSVRAVRNFNP